MQTYSWEQEHTVPYAAALITARLYTQLAGSPALAKFWAVLQLGGVRRVRKISCSLPIAPQSQLAAHRHTSEAGILVGNPTRNKRQSKPSNVLPWSNLLTTQLHCRRGDVYFSSSLKEKSQSRPTCPKKGALKREQRAVRSWVDRDPSLQLCVNSLKGKITGTKSFPLHLLLQ